MAGTKHSIIANVPTWVTPGGTYVAVVNGTVINNTLFDAKGDIITATAADTPARLAVGADGEVLTADSTAPTGLKWAAGGSGAPTNADYLVGTANGSLSAEIVVGTTPGGELGGTWASPTVDATHSGSTHAATQAAAESTAATALSGHAADTTSIHGIADTAQLALLTQVPAVVLKTADESVTSSTVLQDDNELTFAVSANSIYWFQFYIVYESTTAGDIKFQIVTTADEDRFSYSWPGNLASAAGAAYGSLGDYGASPSALPAQGLGVTVSVIAFAVGMLDTGASGGVVKLQWAQDTSNGTAAKVKTGSFVLYQKVV